MGATEITANDELRDIVRPFADLMDGPGGVLPGPGRLEHLQQYYGAEDHDDFHYPEGYVPWERDVNVKHYMMLPYTLALGLHAVGPRELDGDATLQTYATYAAARPLALVYGGPGMQERVQRGRATSVLAAAIISAAVEPQSRFLGDNAEKAIKFSRSEGLVSRGQARLLRSTAALVRPR
jgi:hypothetical protein